jgi:hypothetical protein
MSRNIHNFHDDLRFSHSAENWPGWEDLYRGAFPGFMGMMSHRQNGPWQELGIDRSVILNTSKQILIDEKVRRTDWGRDIALEFVSNNTKGTPGWVCKELTADYIAYLVAPAGRGYLLPVIQMQNAWAKYGDGWRTQYHIAKAPNKGYTTLSCCVPEDVLFPAMGGELRVSFEPFSVD